MAPAKAQNLDLAGANQTLGSLLPYSDIFSSAGSATLTAQMGVAQTYAGVLRDNGGSLGLTKSGTGALTLTGANTFSGTTTINTASRIVAGAANTLSATSLLNTTSSGVLDLGGFDQAINGLVGTGASGGVRNSSGALATLTIGTAADVAFAGNIGGNNGTGDAIRVIKTGVGEQSFTRASSYTGGTELAAGTLGFGSGGAFGTGAIDVTGAATLRSHGFELVLANDIVLGARLTLAGTTFTLAGDISGTGSLDMTGAGFHLTGDNSFSGGIFLDGSGLVIGSEAAAGTGSITASGVNSSLTVAAGAFDVDATATLANNIVLDFASSSNGINLRSPVAGTTLFLDGTISGTGRLFFSDGGGTIVLNRANSFVGNLNVNQGLLGIAVNGAFGGAGNAINMAGPSGIVAYGDNITIANSLRAASVVDFNTNGHALTYAGAIGNLNGGVASVVKSGAGTLVLTGAKTYTGTTTINAGTLELNGSLVSNITVATGGTLSGTGAVGTANTIVVSSGGTINPGASASAYGTLTGGTIDLLAGSTLRIDLSTPDVFGSGVNDAILASNYTIRDGAILEVNFAGQVTPGLYPFLRATSLATQNGGGFVLAAAPTDFTYQVIFGQTTSLLVTFDGVRQWDGSGASANGIIDGGSGTWTSGSANWTNTSGVADLVWGETRGVFTGTAGTVTIAGTQSFNSLEFATAGYVVTGDALTSVGGTIVTGNTGATTVNSIINGTGGLTKAGVGTLVLGASNSFTGGLAVTGGTVQVVRDGSLGADAATFAAGTTLRGSVGAAPVLANAIVLGGAVTFDANGGRTTLSGIVGGAGPLTISDVGPATLNAGFLLHGVNSFIGDVSITNTSVQVLADSGLGDAANDVALSGAIIGFANTSTLTSARAINLVGANRLLALGSAPVTLTGVVSGAGRLTKDGSETLVLANAANSYAGGTAIAAGVLSVVSDGALGAAAGGIDFTADALAGGAGPTLRFTGDLGSARAITIAAGVTGTIDTLANTVTLSGAIAGGGTLAKSGSGRLVLTGTGNSHAGGTSLDAGVLQIDNGTAIGSGALATAGGTTLVAGIGTGSAAITLANAVRLGAGVTSLDLQGTSFLVDTVSGLVVTDGTDLILDGVVSGAGSLETNGTSGRVFVNAGNSMSGGVVLERVVAYLGADAALGTGIVTLAESGGIRADTIDVSIANVVALDGTTNTIGGSAALTLTGAIIGTSTLAKVGTGALVLAGTSALTGAVDVNQGSLIVDGALAASAASVNVAAGALLGGDGSIAGTVTVADGATLSGGTATTAGSLAIGDLNLANDAQLVFQLGEAGRIGGAFNDQIAVSGALVLDGRLTVTASTGGTFGPGLYNLFTYGTLTDNGLDIDALPAGFSGMLQTNAGAQQVNLVVGAAGASFLYWDGTDTIGNGAIDGGNGTWSATAFNWTGAAPSGINTTWSPDSVGIFAGTAGTITLASGVSAQGLQFQVDGYTLAGSELALQTATGMFVITDPGVTATIDSVLSGGGALAKQGTGTLVLGGVNDYAGGTTLSAGKISVKTGAALGTGALAMADATTLAAGVTGLTLANAITTAGRGTIDSGAGALTLGGSITGAGSIAKAGTGTLLLNGINSFAALAIDQGTVTIGNATAAGSGAITLGNNAALAAGVPGLVLANTVTTTANGTIDSGAGSFTLNGSIGGAGSIGKAGTGNLVLNGANSFAGLAINQGAVTIGTSTAAGTGAIGIGNNATLAAGASGLVLANAITATGTATVDTGTGIFTLNGNIAGTGSIAKNGAGTLVLNGASSFANLGINQGKVTIGTSTSAGTGTITIGNNATLVAGASVTLANRIVSGGSGFIDTGANTATLNGIISGIGSLVKQGSGSLVINAVNTITGPTTVAAGRLTVNGSLAGSATTVQSGAALGGAGTVGALAVQSGGTVAPGRSVGTLGVNGALVLAAGSTYQAEVDGLVADRITASGAASIAGNLVVTNVSVPGAAFNSSYVLLSSSALTGTFSTASLGSYSVAFNPTLEYTPTAVILRLTPNSLVTIGGSTLTGNPLAVATAFDAAVRAGYNPQPFLALYTQGGNLASALGQLSGEMHSAERRVLLEDTRVVREAAFDRLNAGLAAISGANAVTTTDGETATSFWLRAAGSWGKAKADGVGSRFETEQRGVLTGIDFAGNGFKAGAMFHYTSTDLTFDTLGKSKLESTGGALYAGYRQPGQGFAVGLGGSIAGNTAKGSRAITATGLQQSLTSNVDGTTYQVFGEVAYDLIAGDTVRVEPFGRVAHAQVSAGAFKEVGGIAALDVKGQRNDLTIVDAGLRGAIQTGIVELSGSAAWHRTTGDRTGLTYSAITGLNSQAGIRAAALDRDAIALEAKADVTVTSTIRIGAGYSGVIGSKNKDHGARATLTIGF